MEDDGSEDKKMPAKGRKKHRDNEKDPGGQEEQKHQEHPKEKKTRKRRSTFPTNRHPKDAKASPKLGQKSTGARSSQPSPRHGSLPLSGGRQRIRYVVKSSFAPDVIARAAGTERHGRTPGGLAHQDESVPENETPEQRRLRKNRINERRKRARRAMKVDYINEQYHNLRMENDRLKNDNERLRSQIDGVRSGRLDPSELLQELQAEGSGSDEGQRSSSDSEPGNDPPASHVASSGPEQAAVRSPLSQMLVATAQDNQQLPHQQSVNLQPPGFSEEQLPHGIRENQIRTSSLLLSDSDNEGRALGGDSEGRELFNSGDFGQLRRTGVQQCEDQPINIASRSAASDLSQGISFNAGLQGSVQQQQIQMDLNSVLHRLLSSPNDYRPEQAGPHGIVSEWSQQNQHQQPQEDLSSMLTQLQRSPNDQPSFLNQLLQQNSHLDTNALFQLLSSSNNQSSSQIQPSQPRQNTDLLYRLVTSSGNPPSAQNFRTQQNPQLDASSLLQLLSSSKNHQSSSQLRCSYQSPSQEDNVVLQQLLFALNNQANTQNRQPQLSPQQDASILLQLLSSSSSSSSTNEDQVNQQTAFQQLQQQVSQQVRASLNTSCNPPAVSSQAVTAQAPNYQQQPQGDILAMLRRRSNEEAQGLQTGLGQIPNLQQQHHHRSLLSQLIGQQQLGHQTVVHEAGQPLTLDRLLHMQHQSQHPEPQRSDHISMAALQFLQRPQQEDLNFRARDHARYEQKDPEEKDEERDKI